MGKINAIKYIFTFLILIHGLIHLIGFVKAFFSTEASKQVLGISKPIGALWLIVCVMFIATSVSFFNNKKWFFIAFIAVCISQILILSLWKEAKFGTIVNVIILLVGISAFGNRRFDKMIKNEVNAISIHSDSLNKTIITENEIQNLPEIVALWLRNSNIIGKERVRSVKLKQKGELRLKPDSKWMPFEATQYFNVENPSFVWSTTVQAMPMLNMIGRDKLVDGKGEMLIKLVGLFPVVNECDNEKVNSGSMIRYLSEICWFPSAALNDYITWKSIDETSAEATLTHNNQSVSGTFLFTATGKLLSFEANRYYGGGKDATLETWLIENLTFKECNSVRIPNKSKVIWKLNEGDFHWLTVEVNDIEYNVRN